jgi:glycerophosphoryl diester phosphodiesterase
MLTFAHRGGRGHGADNTIETFTTALARGARGLETDAWLTADGVVVLDHDGAHRAAARRRTPMRDVCRADLPPHIPTLDELYEQCGADFDVAIDVRLPEVGGAVIDVARRHQALPRLWLVATTPEHLDGWRAYSEEVHLAVTLRLADRRRTVLAAVQAAGADAVNMRWPWWTRALVNDVHRQGLRAFGYDVQSSLAIRRCMRIGLDGIFSDHVAQLHKAIAG